MPAPIQTVDEVLPVNEKIREEKMAKKSTKQVKKAKKAKQTKAKLVTLQISDDEDD